MEVVNARLQLEMFKNNLSALMTNYLKLDYGLWRHFDDMQGKAIWMHSPTNYLFDEDCVDRNLNN